MPIVDSYAPELIELLKRAAQESIEITLNSRKQATRLCFQLNMLRKAMREEQHPLMRVVSDVNVSVSKDGNLLARPADSTILAAIRAAGNSDNPPTIIEYDPVHEYMEHIADPSEQLPPALGDEETKAALRAFLTDAPIPVIGNTEPKESS